MKRPAVRVRRELEEYPLRTAEFHGPCKRRLQTPHSPRIHCLPRMRQTLANLRPACTGIVLQTQPPDKPQTETFLSGVHLQYPQQAPFPPTAAKVPAMYHASFGYVFPSGDLKPRKSSPPAVPNLIKIRHCRWVSLYNQKRLPSGEPFYGSV